MPFRQMNYSDHLDDIFDELTDLTPLQRHILKQRYRFLMNEYRFRCRLYAWLFHTLRLTMTIGSLAVPALLTIQNTPGASQIMYWVTWSISLAVTASHGITTLFRLDKRYYSIHATAERLRSETWQYIQLSGRYSGHHGYRNRKPTHANQHVYYCTQLEKINMKRIDNEYIKAGEDPNPPAPPSGAEALAPGAKPSGDTMVPSPPELDTPASQTNSTTKTGQIESRTIVGDEDEEGHAKNAITLQMSGSPPTSMSADNPTRLPFLQNTSTM